MTSVFDMLLEGSLNPEASTKPATTAMEALGYTSRNVETLVADRDGVGDSRDLRRISELPRRPRPDEAELSRLVTKWNTRLGRGDVSCTCEKDYKRRCAKSLLPVQAWALEELSTTGGLLGPIGVGHGKSLLDLLAAMAVPGVRVAVLFIPPSLRSQMLQVDWGFYGQHWKLPNLGSGRWFDPALPMLHVHSYSELSSAKASELIESIKPDLIIADEAHNLRNASASRTKRFRRYFTAAPNTKLAAWSGTLTSKSIKDYAALSDFALGEGSPTPRHWPTVEEWAEAIDPSEFPASIGKLRVFCEPGEDVRFGYQRRVLETAGVVSTADKKNCEAALNFYERKVLLPKEVEQKLFELNQLWQRPDGEELVDAMSVHRCAKELAAGFFYRWTWPRQETPEMRKKWLQARKDWHKELRERLKLSRPQEDSPLLCAKAAIRWHHGFTHIEELEDGTKVKQQIAKHTKHAPQPTWASECWPAWEELRETCQPQTEGVWVDDWLAKDAAEWARSNTGIVWYEHDVFGRLVAQLADRPHYGPGAATSAGILTERGARSIVASLRAHGTGKNLQSFARNLVANPPSDAAAWEQGIGRTHRQGQLADEVEFYVYRHASAFVEALERAKMLAQYVQDTLGAEQKLLKATYDFL